MELFAGANLLGIQIKVKDFYLKFAISIALESSNHLPLLGVVGPFFVVHASLTVKIQCGLFQIDIFVTWKQV